MCKIEYLLLHVFRTVSSASACLSLYRLVANISKNNSLC
jgi:hypothetical protein